MKNIFIDTDIGSDCDDAGALAVLHTLSDSGFCNIIGMTYCLSDESGPATMDAINLYYDKTDIPIGRLKKLGYLPNSNHPFTDVVKEEFPHRYGNGENFEDATRLYRKIFSAQPDKSITVVAIGPLKNIELFLNSQPDEYSNLTGAELFNQKVETFCIMGGSFYNEQGEVQPEFNIYSDIQAATTVFEKCKTDIYIVPSEVGINIVTGEELMKTGDTSNPIYRCYKLYCNGARSSWDLCTVLYAVVPTSHHKMLCNSFPVNYN